MHIGARHYMAMGLRQPLQFDGGSASTGALVGAGGDGIQQHRLGFQ